VVADGYELYIVGSEAMLMAYRGVLQDRAEIIDGAVKVAADYRAMSLRVTVGPDEPGAEPALPELSTATDITVVATIDILAMDRDGFDSRHTPTPADVEVIEVRTYDQVVEYETTSALAWGYPPSRCTKVCPPSPRRWSRPPDDGRRQLAGVVPARNAFRRIVGGSWRSRPQCYRRGRRGHGVGVVTQC
jgi:hypothetical protein